MSGTTRVNSGIQIVAPETLRGIDQTSSEDALRRARKVLAGAIGIDSHIDTIQGVMMGEDLGKLWARMFCAWFERSRASRTENLR